MGIIITPKQVIIHTSPRNRVKHLPIVETADGINTGRWNLTRRLDDMLWVIAYCRTDWPFEPEGFVEVLIRAALAKTPMDQIVHQGRQITSMQLQQTRVFFRTRSDGVIHQVRSATMSEVGKTGGRGCGIVYENIRSANNAKHRIYSSFNTWHHIARYAYTKERLSGVDSARAASEYMSYTDLHEVVIDRFTHTSTEHHLTSAHLDRHMDRVRNVSES